MAVRNQARSTPNPSIGGNDSIIPIYLPVTRRRLINGNNCISLACDVCCTSKLNSPINVCGAMKRLFFISVFLFVCFSMNAQTAYQNRQFPENLDFDMTRLTLVDASNWKKLSPEQIALLGEFGFDTKNYYAKCKQLRRVRDLSSAGLLACGIGGLGLMAWTDKNEEGEVVYNKGRLIAGGTCVVAMIIGMVGLGSYLKKEYRMIVGEAENACVKIGTTESGVGLTLSF